MAFIFPISCILALIFPIFIKYFPKIPNKITEDKYLTPSQSTRSTRSSHNSQYCRPQTYSDALKYSFFPRTIPHWSGIVWLHLWSQLRPQSSFRWLSQKLFFFFFFQNSKTLTSENDHIWSPEYQKGCKSKRPLVKTPPSQNVPELVKTSPNTKKILVKTSHKTSPFLKGDFSKKYGILTQEKLVLILMYESLKWCFNRVFYVHAAIDQR